MNQIKAIRKARGYTQQTLADALGVERPTVGMWEIGRSYPTVEMLIRLADLLGVTTDAMLGLEDKGQTDKEDKSMEGITLNDLLGLYEGGGIQLTVPLTERLSTTVSADLSDSAELDDIVRLYGERRVGSLDINAMRDTLMVRLV